MEALSTFFRSNLILVFFVYGLAFFVMGMALALEARRSSALVLATSLPFLAIFALLHSFVDWIDMFILIESHAPVLSWDTNSLRILKVVMLAVSTACLVQFGAELIVRTYQKHYWLRWLSLALFVFWALNALLFPHYSPFAETDKLSATASEACLSCHSPEVRVDVISRQWMPGADVSARYILYLPGSILAALAFAIQGKSFVNRMRLKRVGRDCQFVAGGFALNAFFAGVVVPPVAYFPSWIINYDSFFRVIGIPPQVIRAALALSIAFFIVRVLRVFEIDHNRQLEAANEERFRAQQEALEVQRRAQAEIEQWNRELENRVEERTKEIQQRNKELATLNTVAAVVNQSLDLDKILGDTLDKVLEVMEVDAGAIFLYDQESKDLVLDVHRGLPPELLERIAKLAMDDGLYGELMSFRTLTAASLARGVERQRDPVVAGGAPLLQDGSHPVATVPLKSKGRLHGVICVVGSDGHGFSGQLLELLVAIANQISLGLDNAQLYSETRQREKEAEALYVVGTEISSVLDISKILNSVVDKAAQLLGTEAALLSLVDEKSGEVYVQATSGCRTQELAQVRLRPGVGINGKVAETGLPVRVVDYQTDSNVVHEAQIDGIVLREGLRAHLGVPLRMGERVFGSLVVADRSPRHFSDGDEYLLLRLANQAAIAIENARLYREVQNLAVLEERYRIAREMHDGLAQVLGYLNLKVKALGGVLTKGAPDQALADIAEMEQVIQSTYADVRESILSLRTPILPGKGFLPTLTEFLQGFSQQSRINVHLEVAEEKATEFSEAVQVQLVRIIQEALANVRKHAKANSAWVRFSLTGDCTEVAIEDNGHGFDLAKVPQDGQQHLGLHTMRERAEGIGGTIEIIAAPDRGTKVVVRIPFSREGVS